MTVRNLWTRTVAASVTLVMFASIVGPDPAVATPKPGGSTVPRHTDRAVPVTPVQPKAAKPDPAAAKAVRGTPTVSWPRTGAADVRLTAAGQAAGKLPVRVAAAPAVSPPPDRASAAGAGSGSPASVRVEVLDRPAGDPSTGMVLRVRRTDDVAAPGPVSLTVDYSGFRQAYGGDWASRLRLVRRSDGAVVAAANNLAAGTLTARAQVSGVGETFAVTAGPSGQAGSYKATPLPLQSSWQVNGQTGEFTWSYPLRLPDVPGNLVPQLAIAYSSAAVDGRTASTNNQPAWVGEGFDLSSGYIERSYKGCNEDPGNNGSAVTGDQCWVSDNATLSLAGHAGSLVRDDASGVWKLASDDGTRIERLFGTAAAGPVNGDDDYEYWRVTTNDGTQYFFGQLPQTQSTQSTPVFGNNPSEPCNKSTFAASGCRQGYRWNLDHVIDARGNAIVYTYAKERNSYGLNGGAQAVQYDRAAVLQRVDYGLRQGAEFSGTAPASVVFETAPRCAPGANCGVHTPQSYPDTPFDQECSSGCATLISPTFWSTLRLNSITTRVGTTNVEKWTLNQDYPDPGDKTSPGLSLKSIEHIGLYGGTATLPSVTFNREARANRVDTAADGISALDKYRVIAINNESGGTTTVNYAPPNCLSKPPAADTNTLRCFPVYWAPDGSPEREDWMHKYVVDNITQVDNYGGSPTEVTYYQYVGDAAWHYNDSELLKPERRTWSEWRGYSTVVIRHGESTTTQNITELRYFRGMNGDRLKSGIRSASVEDSQHVKLADDDQLNGFVRETTTRNGEGGPVVATTINDPWQSTDPTAQRGSLKAYILETKAVTDLTALDGGAWRRKQVVRDYDTGGQVTQIDDRGDLDVAGDEECTRTWYARNASTGLVSLPSRAQMTATACGSSPAYPAELAATTANAISDVRTFYDNSTTPGAAPSAGLPTKLEQINEFVGGKPSYITTTATTYDSYGRPLVSTDALGRKTTTTYVETGGITSRMTVTNNLGQATITDLSPAWGEATTAFDANNRRTDVDYDALGRVTGVWLPGRSKAALQGPNLRYAYNVRANGTTSVRTDTLRANDNYVSSYTIYDGFQRVRQTQSPAWGGGRVLTDTVYDSRGLPVKSNNPYYAEGNLSDTLYGAGDQNIPSQTVTTFDGSGRPLTVTLKSKAVPQWSSVTTYHGDHTDLTPPRGGTATSTYVDVRGRTTAVYQYLGATASGGADITRYTYANGGQLATVTDQAGNQWRYGYDLLGRRTTVHDPDAGDSTATFDDAGQLLAARDGRGKTLAYVYDGTGRRTEERDTTTSGTLLAKWTYDQTPSTAGDGLTSMKGLPSSSTRWDNGNAYTTTFVGYDAANRPSGVKVTIPTAEGKLAGTYQTNFTYRPDGSPASIELPSAPNSVSGELAGETLTYTYDDLGMPKTLKGSGGYTATYVAGSSYTRFTEPEQFAYGTAGHQVTSNFYYDEATRRLTRMLTQREAVTPSAVDDFRYGYDPAGNVTGIADEPDSGPADIQCFNYDYLRRMTESWTVAGACSTAPSTSAVGGQAPYWTTYTYDKTGNRKSQTQHGLAGAADTVRTYTYPATGGHTLSSVTTTSPGGTRTDSYGYDKAGNTTTRSVAGTNQTLDWDVTGRLTSARTTDGATAFVYDADGNRLLRREPDGVTLYLGAQEFRLDRATNQRTGTRYYTNGGETVALRTGNSLCWLVSDQHGTAATAVRADNLAVTRRLFTPFGDARGAVPAWPGERGFVGGVRDQTLNLTQLGAREYDPATGRFVSADPIVDPMDPQQLNGYAYADNSPATFSDPDGLKYFVDVDGLVTIPSLAHATPAQIQRATAKAAKVTRINNAVADKIKRQRAAAAKASGHSEKEIADARKIKQKSVFDVVLEAGGEILKEFLGIDDIKGCFGEGDIGSCISMAINVIPWGKIFRIGELIGAVKKAWKAVQSFLKRSKEADNVLGDFGDAMKAAKKADDMPGEVPTSRAQAEEPTVPRGQTIEGDVPRGTTIVMHGGKINGNVYGNVVQYGGGTINGNVYGRVVQIGGGTIRGNVAESGKVVQARSVSGSITFGE
jgi:RHS repeat-associated protein